VVAGLVRDAAAGDVALPELVAAHPDLGPDAALLLEPGAAVRRRTTAGGAGPGPVADQLRRFAERLDLDRARIPR
jgi:argininosuccinate lyase